MEVKLKGDGTIISASTRKSSGFKALDEEALEMLKRGVPYPTPPQILQDRTFTIFVPISLQEVKILKMKIKITKLKIRILK